MHRVHTAMCDGECRIWCRHPLPPSGRCPWLATCHVSSKSGVSDDHKFGQDIEQQITLADHGPD